MVSNISVPRKVLKYKNILYFDYKYKSDVFRVWSNYLTVRLLSLDDRCGLHGGQVF